MGEHCVNRLLLALRHEQRSPRVLSKTTCTLDAPSASNRVGFAARAVILKRAWNMLRA